MAKPLFIGEAPSRSTSRPGAAPLVGESGRRLAAWAGLSPADFRERAALVNLFDELPERWNPHLAQLRAAAMWEAWGEEVETVVLLGVRVTEAFGLSTDAVSPFVVMQTAGPPMAWMPHPSGLNHFWNEAANVRRAERFLRRLLGNSARRERQARLPMM